MRTVELHREAKRPLQWRSVTAESRAEPSRSSAVRPPLPPFVPKFR